MASYLYYVKDISPIDDSQYDEVCKQLILKYQDIEHQHGHLITKDALHAGTAFHLRDADYPKMVQCAAYAWVDKGSPITCSLKTRRRRRAKPEALEPEVKPTKRVVRRKR